MTQAKVKIVTYLSFMLSSIILSTAAWAQPENKKVKELRYQEVFYHFYRKDAFNAIVNLSAGIRQDNLPESLKRKKLLLGSMYYMYDLDEMAESELFNVIKSNADEQQKAMAWYYLAKIYYKTENFRSLSEALQKSERNLPSSLKSERAYLLGMFYLKLRDFANAEETLKTINENTFWFQMFQFNLGAAYIKANLGEQGTEFIREVGVGSQSNESMLALKDKSNIVLGYYYLRNKDSKNAIDVLENVRLAGPFSNKALLGLGWAYTEKKQFRKALIPWLALTDKDPAQLTVQEAQLAVPFAFMQLNAEDKSLELYQKSIDSYEAVKAEIDLSLGVAKRTSIFNVFLDEQSYDDFTISRNMKQHKDTLPGRVLGDLLQTREFQQMFSTYRDLKQLQAKLITWREQLSQMKVMLRAMPDSLGLEDNKQSTGFNKIKNKQYYDETLITLSDRVKLQSGRLDILLGMYESFVQDHVVAALNKKRQYIITYLSQTRFALAELLDKAQRIE